jgi:hypothetical protein
LHPASRRRYGCWIERGRLLVRFRCVFIRFLNVLKLALDLTHPDSHIRRLFIRFLKVLQAVLASIRTVNGVVAGVTRFLLRWISERAA